MRLHSCLSCMPAALSAVGQSLFPKAGGTYALPSGFTVTAHTGCSGAPANSIEAMRRGVDAGAGVVEFDLQFLPDGAPVLSHDAPQGDCVPLREAFAFLREHPQILANVDVKTTAFLECVPVLAAEYGVLGQIFFTGIEEQDVPAVREKCPGVPYYLNRKIRLSDDPDAVAQKAAALGAIGLNVSKGHLSPAVVRACREKGLLLSVWTIDHAIEARYVLAMQPDNVTTRRPDLVLSIMNH